MSKGQNLGTCVIIPAYNEGRVIKKVLNDTLKHFDTVICINDGSTDNTRDIILETKATLVDHPFNLGQGAAIQTGIEYGLLDPANQYFITFDSDGQHKIHDAKKMLQALQSQDLDIMLGSRFLGKTHNMPRHKLITLKFAIHFTNTFSNIHLTDTHNGLRVFNRRVAQEINISMAGMAHASEIIDKISRKKWNYAEFPVEISYSDYSRAKGQRLSNSVNIVFDLMLGRIFPS